MTPGEVFNRLKAIDARSAHAETISGRCEVQSAPPVFEASVLHLRVSCSDASTVALPVSYNAYTGVFVNGERIGYHRVSGDPRLAIDLGPMEASDVRIELPTFWRILRNALGLG